MSVVTAWLVIGVPALVVAAALFLGRSPWRSLLGYVVLAAGFAGLAIVDRVSAGVFGILLSLLYAAGRGGRLEYEDEDEDPDTVGVPETVEDPGRGHLGASGSS